MSIKRYDEQDNSLSEFLAAKRVVEEHGGDLSRAYKGFRAEFTGVGKFDRANRFIETAARQGWNPREEDDREISFMPGESVAVLFSFLELR